MIISFNAEVISIGVQDIGHNMISRYVEVKLSLGFHTSQIVKILDSVEGFEDIWSKALNELNN